MEQFRVCSSGAARAKARLFWLVWEREDVPEKDFVATGDAEIAADEFLEGVGRGRGTRRRTRFMCTIAQISLRWRRDAHNIGGSVPQVVCLA